jgi:hypothetical protein
MSSSAEGPWSAAKETAQESRAIRHRLNGLAREACPLEAITNVFGKDLFI